MLKEDGGRASRRYLPRWNMQRPFMGFRDFQHQRSAFLRFSTRGRGDTSKTNWTCYPILFAGSLAGSNYKYYNLVKQDIFHEHLSITITTTSKTTPQKPCSALSSSPHNITARSISRNKISLLHLRILPIILAVYIAESNLPRIEALHKSLLYPRGAGADKSAHRKSSAVARGCSLSGLGCVSRMSTKADFTGCFVAGGFPVV